MGPQEGRCGVWVKRSMGWLRVGALWGVGTEESGAWGGWERGTAGLVHGEVVVAVGKVGQNSGTWVSVSGMKNLGVGDCEKCGILKVAMEAQTRGIHGSGVWVAMD